MTYTWLEIEMFPNAIHLIAKIPNGEAVGFPVIEKSPLKRPLAASNLMHQLNWIRTHADAPILLQTLDEFMILNEFISFNDLVYRYDVHVVGYPASALYEKVKVRDGFSLSSLIWVNKSRQPITVDHIFYDDVATVVFWTDGTKTVVKCADGTKYDEYAAFCIALAKKIYGSNSALKRAIKNHAKYSKKRQIEKKFNTENKIEEAVRKYVEHIHKNLADIQSNKEENKDA